MLNDVLYGVAPYIAAGLFAAVPVVRLASPQARRRTLPAGRRDSRRLYAGSLAWRLGLGLVLLGHLVGLGIPNQHSLWRWVPGGTLTVQAAALGFGLLALAGWANLLRARVRPGPALPRPAVGAALADTLFLTLLGLGIVSGLVTAFSYRLGSAWYAVTVAPYLRSFLRFQPDVALVADLPPIVRLHLLSAISLVAVFPFTALGPALAWPAVALKRSIVLFLGRRANVES